MELFKTVHLTFLVIFHLKVIVYQKTYISHTYHYCLEKNQFVIIIKFLTWFTNIFQSYQIIMFDKYYKFHRY